MWGLNRRATPSSVMMNAPREPGSAVAGKSGTSPTQRLPFQRSTLRAGSQGSPAASAEARLYSTRRLAGHEKAQS